jgi:hypothetical protein
LVVYDFQVSGGTIASERFTQIVVAITTARLEEDGIPQFQSREEVVSWARSMAIEAAGIASESTLADFDNNGRASETRPTTSPTDGTEEGSNMTPNELLFSDIFENGVWE